MKRWPAHLLIVGYLSLLGYGLLAHTLSYKPASHPAMYFLVWDMYCGWAGYETRVHIVGEGRSGAYYEIDPAPWGEFKPFGSIGRRHYDPVGLFYDRMAKNVLDHTAHEPIHRVLVIEEAWPKKFNLDDDLWLARYGTPKQFHSYFRPLLHLDEQGRTVSRNANWLSHLAHQSLMNNPRLRQDVHRGRSFVTFDPRRPESSVTPASYQPPER